MNCSHCGSDYVISQGRNTKCKNCGKTSAKIPRRGTPRAKDRPPCPECGSPNPYACGLPKGIRAWSCRSCGRFYQETSVKDKVESFIMEVQIE